MCRKLICLACFVFVLGLVSNASADLVGHWRFDEGSGDVAVDTSGNGNDGTLNGGPTWVPGKNLGALEFDGSDDYVGTSVSLLDNMSDFSMVGWVSARNPTGSRIGLFGQNDLIEMGFNAGLVEIWTAASGTTNTPWIFDNDTWHHIAVVDEGTDMKIYLDGELAVTGAGAASHGTASFSFNIGGGGVWDASGNWFSGAIDDVRLYNHALSETEILGAMEGKGWPYASKPSPADGALRMDTWVSMSWVPGAFAVSHDVYMGDNFDDVNDGLGDTFRGSQDLDSLYFVAGFAGYLYPDGLVPGTTYYWRIDEVNDADPNSPWKGDVWSFTVPSKKAYEPNPADSAEFIASDVTLSWTGGLGSKLNYIFFGESLEEVDAATVGIPVPFTNYTPSGLESEKTYYWRIDQYDGAETHKGDVWSFQTLPDIPISDPDLVGWWKLDEGAGLTAVDWSGNGNHGAFQGDPQWVAGYDGGAVEFDGDDHVDTGYTENLANYTITCWVMSPEAPSGDAPSGPLHREQNYQFNWNHGDVTFRGAAAMNIGGTWHAASYMPLNANRWYHLAATYDGNVFNAYRDGVLITSNSAPSGDPNPESNSLKLGRHASSPGNYFTGTVDEARVYNRALTVEEIEQVMRGDPYVAWNANPGNGATPFIRDALPLTWSAGDNASQHDVYYGTDKDAVDDADTSTPDIYRGRQAGTSYSPPEGVEWGGGPYYWRIDQVNTDETITKGRIWSFTVADFILIDDFEAYNSGDNQIWFAWHDGLGAGAPGVPGYVPGNGTGSAVGDETTVSYTEETIVNGGRQSMPLSYDNNKQGYSKYSETELTLTAPRDWTQEGVAELSLWFRGNPASTGSFVEGPVGTYTMTGSGADIWAVDGVEADEFHYAFKTLTGAGSIQAQVLSVENTNNWAKAGVMIRETFDPDSTHAMTVVTPAQGVSFQRRPETGGTSVNTDATGIVAPYWVKIERDLAGNFTAYSSANGATWQILGTWEPIQMGTNVYIGLAVTSHNAALTCQAVFSNVTTTGTVGPQWTNQDIGIASNDADPLYVAVSNSAGAPAVVVHDDPAAAQIDTWTEWVIPLQALADQGIVLTNVDRIAIGLGTKGNMTVPGGSGKMFIDDVRLTRPTPEPEPAPQP